MPSVHEVARSGFGEGTNELYDRIRPSYQPSTLTHLRRAVNGAGNLDIAEIGSGTGIFTRALLAHPEWNNDIKEIRAVEPSKGMRSTFAATVQDSRVSVTKGTFDATGIEDGWADLVVVAQAFHWCPDYNLAAAEFSRILKPTGVVALVWNLEDRDGAKWVAQVRDTIEAHEQGTPQFRLEKWRQAFETPSYKEAFRPPVENVWSYNLHGNIETVVDRASSKSYIAILPEDKKTQVQQEIRDIVRRGEGLTWIDEKEGLFEYPYKVWVVIANKK